MELSTGQKFAADEIKKWFEEQSVANNMDKPIYRLFGYAGTGKTTTISHIMDALEIRRDTLFAAYTGKAAMVMRKTGGLAARTIHSLIYEAVPPSQLECNKLFAEVKKCEEPIEKARLKAELKEKSKVHFVLRSKSNSDLKHASLLVLDECSMVNDGMLADLLTFKVPMLVLGDPGQLPPIEGEGALTREKPDAMLTEIHRQAKGNPIIDFATRARNNIYIPKITIGTSSHTAQALLQAKDLITYNQIICGKNLTRQRLNGLARQVKGFDSLYPVVGEKLICLKNNAEDGLFNGMICTVVEVGELLDTSIQLKIKRETDSDFDAPFPVKALRAHFEVYYDKEALNNVKWWEKDGTDEFDFGYAITVHKAQGSQWEKVLLWDDKMFVGWNRQDRPKWLYTGITRAIETVVIAS